MLFNTYAAPVKKLSHSTKSCLLQPITRMNDDLFRNVGILFGMKKIK